MADIGLIDMDIFVHGNECPQREGCHGKKIQKKDDIKMPNTAAEPLTTYNCYYVPLCEV
jgi:hypothetical protein